MEIRPDVFSIDDWSLSLRERVHSYILDELSTAFHFARDSLAFRSLSKTETVEQQPRQRRRRTEITYKSQLITIATELYIIRMNAPARESEYTAG